MSKDTPPPPHGSCAELRITYYSAIMCVERCNACLFHLLWLSAGNLRPDLCPDASICRLLFYQPWHSLLRLLIKRKVEHLCWSGLMTGPPGHSHSGDSPLGRRETSSRSRLQSAEDNRFPSFFSFQKMLSSGSGFILASRFSQYTFVDKTHFHCVRCFTNHFNAFSQWAPLK